MFYDKFFRKISPCDTDFRSYVSGENMSFTMINFRLALASPNEYPRGKFATACVSINVFVFACRRRIR